MHVLIVTALYLACGLAKADPSLELGNRREPFVDSRYIDKLRGAAEQRLHQPTPQEVVLKTDKPWEGNASAYFTIFQDGDTYRMYYRGAHRQDGSVDTQVVCYAESDDGIHWRKPNLGLVEYNGSKQNNIVRDGLGVHNFTPFKDDNPDTAPEARYKAVASNQEQAEFPDNTLYAFKSPDGLRWQQVQDEPIIPTSQGEFDSQNLVFWDAARDQYRAYWRDHHNGRRQIRTASSDDFVHWSESRLLKFPGARERELYTNQVMPHPRAPHIVIGFPSRYLGGRGSLVEGLFMSSRDRVTFHRWEEAFIRPGPNQNRWQNRSNYIWWGLVETKTEAKEAPSVWSMYTNEGYREGDYTSIRRYTIRKDGFVSIHAPMDGGQMITRPFTFEGNKLTLNVATSAAGSVRVELQTPGGNPIKGHTLSDCEVIYGDSLSRTVTWKGRSDVGDLAGQPVRLRIKLRDADLYSIKFR